MVIAWILFCFSISGIFAGYFGQWNWVIDLFSHFRVQQSFLLILTALFFFWRKSYVGIIASFVVIMVCLAAFLPYSRFIPRTKHNEQTLSVMLSNVYTSNRQHRRLIDLVKKVDPDILVFEEVNERWSEVLTAELGHRYPFVRVIPREDNFGIALFSKIDFKTLEVRYLGEAHVPSFKGVFNLNDQEVVLWATHPLPPVGAGYWRMRNEHLKNLGKEISKDLRPTIVVGDLNTTPWCYWFNEVKMNRLRDSAIGYGILNSWPTMWPAFFRIPVDHVLVSPEIHIIERKVLENINSDHLPVLVKIGL